MLAHGQRMILSDTYNSVAIDDECIYSQEHVLPIAGTFSVDIVYFSITKKSWFFYYDCHII